MPASRPAPWGGLGRHRPGSYPAGRRQGAPAPGVGTGQRVRCEQTMCPLPAGTVSVRRSLEKVCRLSAREILGLAGSMEVCSLCWIYGIKSHPVPRHVSIRSTTSRKLIAPSGPNPTRLAPAAKSSCMTMTGRSAKEGSQFYAAIIAVKSIHCISATRCQKG
jgi:hypothetical protein